MFLFNLDSKEWIKPYINEGLEYRFGASCCSYKNKMIIFGGKKDKEYSDGNIT